MIQIILKVTFKNAENLHMVEEKQSLTEIEKNIEHLRYRLVRHQIVGIAPPVNLLIELKMAELLLKLESTDTIRVNVTA